MCFSWSKNLFLRKTLFYVGNGSFQQISKQIFLFYNFWVFSFLNSIHLFFFPIFQFLNFSIFSFQIFNFSFLFWSHFYRFFLPFFKSFFGILFVPFFVILMAFVRFFIVFGCSLSSFFWYIFRFLDFDLFKLFMTVFSAFFVVFFLEALCSFSMDFLAFF